jgi:hypothetical protein
MAVAVPRRSTTLKYRVSSTRNIFKLCKSPTFENIGTLSVEISGGAGGIVNVPAAII